ncbi:MAG: PKD domain-containing protein [Deltaproteobacteria bacterium]|nr:PKD domain-containing protein [Deltaproteobacteria bacterium]
MRNSSGIEFLIVAVCVAALAAGCTESKPNQPPAIVLTGPNVARVNVAATFDASETEDEDGYVDLASWSFDFGDGSEPLTGANSASHVFTKAGEFPVTVSVKDDDGAESKVSKVVSVVANSAPRAVLSGPSAVRKGLEARFDASASEDGDGYITEYSFDFEGKTPAVKAGAVMSHVYTAAGSYTVTVEVTDNDGSTGSVSLQVLVTENVPPAALLTGPAVARINQVVTFDASLSADSDGSIASFAFDFGDGTAVAGVSSASHAFASAGPYTVKVEVTDNDGAKATASVLIAVTANAVPVASFTGPTTAVVGEVATFDANGSTDADGQVVSYTFDFGELIDGGAVTANAVVADHTYTAPGKYDVKLTVKDNDGAEGTVTRQITVSTVAAAGTPPTAVFTYPTTAFVNASVQFDGTPSTPGSGKISAYDWDFGDQGTATGAIAHHTFGAAGVYTVKLTVSSTQADGTTVLTNSMSAQINVVDRTIAIVDVAPNTGSIEGGAIFTITGTGFDACTAGSVEFRSREWNGWTSAVAATFIDATNVKAVAPAQPTEIAGRTVDLWLSNCFGDFAFLENAFTYEPLSAQTNRATTPFCPALLTTGGTSLGFKQNEDDVSVEVAMPFGFEYYGQVYPEGTKISVATNGWMSFTSTGYGYSNTAALPSWSYPDTLIAPFFMDMNTGTAGQVYSETRGTAPNRTLVIAWRDMVRRGADGKFLDEKYAFEAILYESSNDIKFQYLNTYGGTFGGGSDAVIGLQGIADFNGVLSGTGIFKTVQPGLAPGGRAMTFMYSAQNTPGYYTGFNELESLHVSSTTPTGGGVLRSDAAAFGLTFSLPVNSNSITPQTILLDDVTGGAQPVTLQKVEVSDFGTKRPVTGTLDLLFPAGATPLTTLTLKAGNRYRMTAKAGTAGIVGANDIPFSQDPTQMACGASGTATDFASQFTAFPGTREQDFITGADFRALAFSSTTNMAFMTTSATSVVAQDVPTLVNAAPTAPLTVALQDCNSPQGIATTDGKKVYVACNGSGKVAGVLYDNAVNPATFTQVDMDAVAGGVQALSLPQIGGNPNSPAPLAAIYAGTRVYVSNGATGANEPSRDAVYLIDPSNNTAGTPIRPVGKKTTSYLGAMAVNATGQLLYVLDVGGSALAVINYGNNTVVKNVDLPTTGLNQCLNPTAVALNPAGTQLFIGCGGTNKLLILDAATYAVVQAVTTSANYVIRGVTFTTNGNLAYLAEYWNSATGRVGVINTEKNTYVATVTLSAGPEAITFVPASGNNPGFGLVAERSGWLDSVR